MGLALAQFVSDRDAAVLDAPLQVRPPAQQPPPSASAPETSVALDLGQTCVAPLTPPSAPPPAGERATVPEIRTGPQPAVRPQPSSGEPLFDQTVLFRKTPHQPASVATTVPDVQLVVTRSVDPRFLGRTFRLGMETIRIGRAIDNDWSLPERSWSRRHAEILYSGGGYVLRDLGSQNGIHVNGRRVTETPLLFGTVIQIGGLEITFSQLGDTALQDFTGCVIADRYTLVKLLRESPRGAVYEATDMRTSASVAIKLLSPALLQYPGYREQFQREARIAARLNHPYICRVADYGPATLTPAGGGPLRTEFLCFELMAGGSLVDRIDAKAAIPLPRVADWLAAIANALEHAHKHQVLHGDLKPSAIVFDEDEHPYVTDFAIAQQVPSGDGGPMMTATPAYMAPELWGDGEVTPASDQFALAAIIYYLVTGSRPFEGRRISKYGSATSGAARHRRTRRRRITAGPSCAGRVAGAGARPRGRSVATLRALSAFAAAFRAALRRIVHKTDGPAIFISYQRNVSAILAMYFADKLRAQGIHAFVDAQGLDGAGPFPPHIERAIEDTDVFVCLLADTTLRAEWVLREIRIAQQFGKPMIPILQESYNRGASASAEPAVADLLRHQGLLVLDRRNLHLEHTVTDLVRLIRSAISQRDQV